MPGDRETRWQQLIGFVRAEMEARGQAPDVLEQDLTTRRLALPLGKSGGVRFALTVPEEKLASGDLQQFAHDLYQVYQSQYDQLHR